MTRVLAFRRGPDAPRDGFIVVTALWMLAALAALASVASVYMAQSAATVAVFDSATQSELLTSAGIELAAYQLSAAPTVRRPTHGSFRFRLAKSDVTVEYLSEAARINLNMAPRAMIASLFAVLGAEADAADRFADRVVGWRSAPKPNGADEEAALYRAAGLTYLPRRGPFNSVDELWLVLGLPATIVEHALPFVTVFSGIGEVNVLDAAPEVIASLPGMTPLRLDAFLSSRESLPPDPAVVLAALGGRQVGASVGGSDAYRIRMRIVLPDGRRKISEGVIMVSGPGDKQAFRVLAWQDEIDPNTGGARGPAEKR
jgi:general secretion pathway protein K